MSPLQRAVDFLDQLDNSELGDLAGRIVLAVGMTAGVSVTVPEPADGCSWIPCYERGLERLGRPKNLR